MKLTGESSFHSLIYMLTAEIHHFTNTLPSLTTITPFVVAGLQSIFIAPDYFPFIFTLSYEKDDCQWTHGSLGMDNKSFKGSREVHDSIQHALFHEPFLLNRGPLPPQYEKQRMTVLHHCYSMVAHTCSTPQNIPSVPSV